MNDHPYDALVCRSAIHCTHPQNSWHSTVSSTLRNIARSTTETVRSDSRNSKHCDGSSSSSSNPEVGSVTWYAQEMERDSEQPIEVIHA